MSKKSNIQELQERSPELMAIYDKIPLNELLEALCGEVLDLLDMRERVQLFNEECTIGMSKPHYKLDAIRDEINARKIADRDDFCADFVEDDLTEEEIGREIRERGKKRLEN